MLRRPPTAITLNDSDLRDFKARAQRRRAEAKENSKQELEQSVVNAQDGTRFWRSNTQAQRKPRLQNTERRTVEPFNRPLTIQTQGFQPPEFDSNIHDQEQTDPSTSLDPFSDVETDTLEHAVEGLDNSWRAFSPENADQETLERPPKDDDFHYGGFMESPSEDYTQNRASPFCMFRSQWLTFLTFRSARRYLNTPSTRISYENST